ncbi:MAG: hypothetical protein LBM61_08560 [Prevotellaceae bacterium]|jgi:hypothetical protein|nr:hypothetical protein [Prevotellaceae bacterium]
MLVVSSKEFSANPLLYMDKAIEGTDVLIRRGTKYRIKLMPLAAVKRTSYDKIESEAKQKMSPTEFRQWLRHYRAIPEEYRCNPFDIIEDGDYFYADTRNVEEIKKQDKVAEKEMQRGDYVEVTPENQKKLLGL